MILLSDLIRPELVRLDVDAKSKEQLFDQGIECLAAAGRVEDVPTIRQALVDREEVMSTGIGRGVAVPHAQCPAAPDLSVCLLRLREPLDYESVDDQPVRLVFLVTGPAARGGFIRVLARISRVLCSEDLHQDLLEVEEPESALTAIRNVEARL